VPIEGWASDGGDRAGVRIPSRPSGRRIVAAWCLYDWACGAFNTVIISFVFATYFVRAVAAGPQEGTSDWAAAQALAGLVIALLAAPLGMLADKGAFRRPMLAGFTALLVVCTAGLWFVRPRAADVGLALGLTACATVAYELAGVFYNAMLPDIAGPGRIGLVSGLAWGSGYVGGLICLTLCLVLLIDRSPPLFGLSADAAEPVRATALFAAGWIALFAAPLLVMMPPSRRVAAGHVLREGLCALGTTVRLLVRGEGTPMAGTSPAMTGEDTGTGPAVAARPGVAAGMRAGPAVGGRAIVRFLIARTLYSDGLTTLFAFGGIFAAGTFGMDAKQTLLLGIALNVSAGCGAFSFAMIEDRIGAKPVVLLALGFLVVLGTCALLARSAGMFWGLALGLGLFVGPAQAASRSLMARLAPAETRNAYFGLYALSGRVTGFIGPLALGVVTAASGSQRAGMAVVVVLLCAGGVLLAATPLRPLPA
jgi:UMF1 family MFS transporter